MRAQGEFAAGARHFTDAAELARDREPVGPRLQARLGVAACAVARGRYEEGERVYRSVLEREPCLAKARYGLAVLLLCCGKWLEVSVEAEVLTHLDRCLSASVWHALAVAQTAHTEGEHVVQAAARWVTAVGQCSAWWNPARCTSTALAFRTTRRSTLHSTGRSPWTPRSCATATRMHGYCSGRAACRRPSPSTPASWNRQPATLPPYERERECVWEGVWFRGECAGVVDESSAPYCTQPVQAQAGRDHCGSQLCAETSSPSPTQTCCRACYRGVGDLTLALADLLTVRACRRATVLDLQSLAYCHACLGQMRRAVAAFEAALDLDPTCAETLHNL